MTLSDFTVTVTESGPPPTLSVAVHGDLDYAHFAELEAVFDHRLPGLPAGAQVVVDLSGVDYCDSCGLRVLLGAAQRTTTAGGELSLRGVAGQPRRALRLTGLDAVLPEVDPAPQDEDARA